MAKSANIYRDVALMALKADEGRWNDGATLEAVISYAWGQLLYRRTASELSAILAELSEDIGETEEA